MRTILITSTCLLALLSLIAPAWSQTETPAHVIKVRADAEIKAIPDKVVIIFGVQSRDSVMSIARERNEAMTLQAIRIAKKFGVTDDDISTEYYTVEPKYRDPNYKNEFVGYIVKRRIVVDLNRFEDYQNMMDDFLNQGIENVQSVQFKVSDPEKYIQQALIVALKKAKAEAGAIASEMGVKVGKVYSIEESYGGGIRSPNPGLGYPSMEMVNYHHNPAMAGAAEESTTFGYLNATASVTMSFEIE